MPRGGARPGAGRPKSPATLEQEAARARRQEAAWSKEAAREHVRQRVCRELEPMLDAQILNAKGLKYLVTRDKKTGKFVRVTEAMARLKQDDAEQLETIEVWEKDPSVQAFTDLLNRALDKPKEQEQEIKLTTD